MKQRFNSLFSVLAFSFLLGIISFSFLSAASTSDASPTIALQVYNTTQTSISNTDSKASPKDWTFMVYLDGDNNLEEAAIDDIDEMEKGGGSNADVNVVALVDRHDSYDTSNGDWKTGRYYEITSDSSNDIDSTMVQDLGEVDMSDPTTLDNFIRFCFNNYPAEKYCLVLWDHGNGVFGACFDDKTGPGAGLTVNEIQTGIKSACDAYSRDIDIIAFDCCLMGMIEVAYELRGYCDYFIASEENIPFDGYNYQPIISTLHADPTMTASSFSSVIVDEYANTYASTSATCLSVIDTSYLSAFPVLINNLVDNLTLAIDEYNSDYLVLYSRRQARGFSDSAFVDLKDLAIEINNYFDIYNLKQISQELINLCDNAISYNWQHSSLGGSSYGLSIFLPLVAYGVSEDTLYNYANRTSSFIGMDWTSATIWGEFVRQYCDTYHLLPQAEPAIYNVDDTINLNLVPFEHQIYSLKINSPNYYELKLDVSSGDGDIRLGKKTGSDIEILGYSKLINPVDSTEEIIHAYLQQDSYLLLVNSKNTTTSCTVSVNEFTPLSIDTNTQIQESSGSATGDGTGHMIQSSCHYFLMDLLADSYVFNLNSSITASYQVNVYNLTWNLLASESMITMGANLSISYNSTINQGVIIEIYCLEGSGSFILEVVGKSATKRFGYSFFAIPIFIISLFSIITIYKRRN